jgi:hypothetical protein
MRPQVAIAIDRVDHSVRPVEPAEELFPAPRAVNTSAKPSTKSEAAETTRPRLFLPVSDPDTPEM